jgi:hypothetical protein
MHDVFSLGLLCADAKHAQLVQSHEEYRRLMAILFRWWNDPLLEYRLREWIQNLRARLDDYDFWVRRPVLLAALGAKVVELSHAHSSTQRDRS